MYIKIIFKEELKKDQEFHVEKYSITGKFLILVVKDSEVDDRTINHIFNLGEILKFISH